MVILEQEEPLAVATFEKVSFEEFLRATYKLKVSELEDNEIVYREMYDKIKLPTRATSGSAGYDFYAPNVYTLSNGFSTIIPTGVRVKLQPGWMLMLVPRSSMGFKHGMRLKNTVGIIDSDYYNADNEGHIMANLTADDYVHIPEGARFMQGIIVPYGVATNAEEFSSDRTGGMGSTGV